MKSTCVSTSQRIVPLTPVVYQSTEGAEGGLEALTRREDACEEVAVPANAFEHCIHREGRRVERVVDLLPAERRGNRRPRTRPHRVDRGDGLPLAVLIRVDQDAAPFRLRPLRRHEPSMRARERARHDLAE